MGWTVQSCPDSIFPDIEFPRGRNETVSPVLNFWMCPDAQPILISTKGKLAPGV